MEISIVGANGSSLTYDLSDKLCELYDSIYMEIDNIKSSYKEVCKGIVIDSKLFNHIIQKLQDLFNASDYEDLASVLNTLCLDNKISTHANFLFSKINIQSQFEQSINSYLKKNNKQVSDDIVDNIFLIKQLENNHKFNKLFDIFLHNTYTSRFAHPKAKSSAIISLDELRSCKDIAKILSAIEAIKKKHMEMYDTIEELYKSTLSLINYINLALLQKE